MAFFYLSVMNEQKVKMPSGIPFIVGNEAAERFSYYGMKGILAIFMTKYLVDHSGALDVMSDEDAKFWVHIFQFSLYILPIAGSFIADALIGKYKTIMWLSVVYCLGHLALALDETRLGLSIGLTLIAIGSGGIKPCVAAHVGDQFGESQKDLIPKVYSYFYWSINVGSILALYIIPDVLDSTGSPSIAFGIPGALMLLATFVFWLGRNKYIHIPPVGVEAYTKSLFGKEGLDVVKRLVPIYAFMIVFWSLLDQTGSSLVLQAAQMDRVFNVFGYSFEVLPSQVQSLNPFIIITLVPVLTFFVYPKLNWSSMTKMRIGFFFCFFSFVLVSVAQGKIDEGLTPSISWQMWSYFVITLAEILVYLTALEFSYTQAPNELKSLVGSLNLSAIALGNLFTAIVNLFVTKDTLSGASYYWFFAGLMLVAAILFIPVSMRYKERTYVQNV